MKVKNIIIGMLVAIGALTSCTSEEPIEPQVNREARKSVKNNLTI